MIKLYDENETEYLMVPANFLIIESCGSFKNFTHIKVEDNFQNRTFLQVTAYNNEESYGTINYKTMVNMKYIACTYEQFLKMKAFI